MDDVRLLCKKIVIASELRKLTWKHKGGNEDL